MKYICQTCKPCDYLTKFEKGITRKEQVNATALLVWCSSCTCTFVFYLGNIGFLLDPLTSVNMLTVEFKAHAKCQMFVTLPSIISQTSQETSVILEGLEDVCYDTDWQKQKHNHMLSFKLEILYGVKGALKIKLLLELYFCKIIIF